MSPDQAGDILPAWNPRSACGEMGSRKSHAAAEPNPMHGSEPCQVLFAPFS